MNRISKNFCNWLKKLPGEDHTVNNFSENDVKNMFDVSEDDQEHDHQALHRLHEQIHKHWSKIALSVKFLDARFRYLHSGKSLLGMDAMRWI